ncbi:MAG: hypothetical protein LUQ39_03810 [Methanomassiliicoccales archaeon]|nr:hypothetical protein [Methanomassiliicoccales archaeon]
MAAEPSWSHLHTLGFFALGTFLLLMASLAAFFATAICLQNLRKSRLRTAAGYLLMIVMVGYSLASVLMLCEFVLIGI